MLDGRRDQVAATFRTGDITVIRDGLASTRPNEVGDLFRYRGVLPEPRYVGPQVVTTTRAPRSARSSTYARPSPRPAPVTTATFPSNEIRSVISLSFCGMKASARNRDTTVGALCPFGKARFTSPAIDNASASGKFLDVRLCEFSVFSLAMRNLVRYRSDV